jgi:hypothetical protein
MRCCRKRRLHAAGLCLLLLIVLSACASVDFRQFPGAIEGEGRTLTMWLLADIQPPTPADRVSFERAVRDIAAAQPEIDIGVIAGDLLKARSGDEAFAWFLATRAEAPVRHWYEIAGNHDVRSGARFRRYFPGPDYYAVEVGNLLLLLLSDQSTASTTDISAAAFTWWREQVRANPDKTIITVSHGQLRRSGLLGSAIASRRITDSARFEEVLAQSPVALWASGHSHLPQGLAGTAAQVPALGSTLFVNVGSIIEGPFLASESRLLFLQEGSDILWLRSRNHSRGAFAPGLDIALRLRHPFRWDGTAPLVHLPAASP